MQMLEHWRPAPGFEGLYEVSNCGGIRSVERRAWHPNGHWVVWSARRFRAGCNGSGYPQVDLRKDGRRFNVRVHRLVAEAFLLPSTKSDETYVNHRDLNKTNNRASNLEWISFAENVRHAAAAYKEMNGRTRAPRGEDSGRALVTEDQVREMRSLRKSTGMTYRRIAERYGVGPHVVMAACQRKTWRHVA